VLTVPPDVAPDGMGGHNRPMSSPAPAWRPLAGLFAGSGLAHLAVPRLFTPIVPRRLGDPRPWVFWSGVAELVCAAGLAVPSTRRAAGYASAGLLVAVYPANVQMAVTHWRAPRRGGAGRTLAMVGTAARLPLQVPLVARALRVARGDRP